MEPLRRLAAKTRSLKEWKFRVHSLTSAKRVSVICMKKQIYNKKRTRTWRVKAQEARSLRCWDDYW